MSKSYSGWDRFEEENVKMSKKKKIILSILCYVILGLMVPFLYAGAFLHNEIIYPYIQSFSCNYQIMFFPYLALLICGAIGLCCVLTVLVVGPFILLFGE